MNKVLFVCEGLNESTIFAQPWKHVMELAKRIEQSGFEIKIISDGSQSLGEEGKLCALPIMRIKKRGLFFDTATLSRLLSHEDSSIVNWHCSDIWSSYYFWRLRHLRLNVIWTLHSGILSVDDIRNLGFTDSLQLFRFWNNILSASFPKPLIRKWTSVPLLSHVITLSKRTALRLGEYGISAEHVTSVPSGVDIELFKPSRNSGQNDFEILYFGPLSSLRGIDVVLSSYKLARKKIPSVRLTVLARKAGENDYWVKKARSLGRVEVVGGLLSQEQIVDYLDRASVVVLPFKFWPQIECPSTILEAMSMRKPVITTSTGAIPEIVKNWENGIIVPSRDFTRIAAKALVKLSNDPTLTGRIGNNAREHIERNHDWKRIVRDTLNILSRYAG
jgi:glycosyltransferase involved in cell wall biosynthesis